MRLISFLFVLFSTHSIAGVELVDKKKMQSNFNIHMENRAESFYGNLDNLKIAILDNGFEQRSDLIERLGSKLHVVKKYPEKFLKKYKFDIKKRGNSLARTSHGSSMAMIVEGLLANSRNISPDIYLLNAHGITNFERAVSYAIDKKVNVILYAQNWEFGGNYDGQGFINKMVDKIEKHNIFWINAAGNYSSMVWNGSYRGKDGKNLYLQNEDYLEFQVKFDNTSVTITAVWNDFKNYENYQTNKDIDVEVYHDGVKLAYKNRKQSSSNSEAKLKSLHSREQAKLKLDRGLYKIKLVDQSNNLDYNDRFRVVLQSDKGNSSINFLDASRNSEIMIPADNKLSFTVGDRSKLSSVGPTADGRSKPDYKLHDSRLRFSDGNMSEGSSNAAAIYSAVLLHFLAEYPDYTRAELLNTP